MTENLEARLAALADEVAEVFLAEATPEAWSGVGVKPADLSKEQRGNRSWDIKNANQLGLLFARALELTQRVKWAREGGVAPPGGNLGPVDPESDMKRFEADATRLLERAAARR